MQYIINRLKRVVKSYSGGLNLDELIARRDYSRSDSSDEELKRIIDELNAEKPIEKETIYEKYSENKKEQKKEPKKDDKDYVDSASFRSACSILGVPDNATPLEIKDAYRKLLMKYHPDKAGKLSKELQEIASKKTLELNYAYSVMKQAKGFN